jgi:hypothetical protein
MMQNFITPRWDSMQSGEDGDRPLLMSIMQYANGDAASAPLDPEAVADVLQQYAAQWPTQYVGQMLMRQGNGCVDSAAIQTNANADIPPPIVSPPTNAARFFRVKQ